MLWAISLVLLFFLAAWLVGHLVDKLFLWIETTLENRSAVRKEFDASISPAELERASEALRSLRSVNPTRISRNNVSD